MSSNCLIFHTSKGISSSSAAFLFLIFLSTESSSSVNGPSSVSDCLLINRKLHMNHSRELSVSKLYIKECNPTIYKKIDNQVIQVGEILDLVWQYPPANPTISASLNHSWPVIHLVFCFLFVFFFSSLARGISHFFTDTQSTTERVEETNKHELGLAPSARGGSLWHFLCILWANANVYLIKNSHKASSKAD